MTARSRVRTLCSRAMRLATLAAITAPALLLAAGCASTPHHPAAHHPARLTVLGDCRTLRADVLANGGTADARTVEYLLRQDPGDAGAVHGRHGLTFDLDWLDDAVTARDRGTPAGVLTIGTWQAALDGDCERAAGVSVPYPQG